MGSRPEEFPNRIKLQALSRQDFLCGGCGCLIVPFGGRTLVSVAWGETAHAHHRRPIRSGGRGTLHNCVILCESCHYSAHEGGDYARGTVVGRPEDYLYFYGTEGRRS